jgi:transcriptional regulator with GAF, ATPase, and Fis domain
MNDTLWLSPAACPLLQPAACMDPVSFRLVQRLLEMSLAHQGSAELARALLEEIAGVLRGDQATVFETDPDWQPRWQFVRRGTRPLGECLPRAFLAEVLARQAGASQPPAGCSPAYLAACLGSPDRPTRVLLVARPREPFQSAELEYAVAAAHYLGVGLERAHSWDERSQAVDHLESLVALGRRLLGERSHGPLLEHLAEQAARLLDCERADLFLWDQARGELVGQAAPGGPNGERRMPDDTGVAGQVLHTGQAVRFDEGQSDPAGRAGADGASGPPARSLLCLPLVGAGGQRLGVVQVANKTRGPFTPRDVQTLQELAAQAAAALANVREREALSRSHAQLEGQVRQDSRLIGESTAVRTLRATLERVALTDLPVLILGESGTGKKLVARALHYSSPRQHHPFVPVHCAAGAENLAESELFGHEQGALTGAVAARAGKCEAAHGGTLYLNEVGDLGAGGQVQLLRVLEEKAVYRAGGDHPVPVDVRVVAATRRDLAEDVQAGQFREDLYYRLAVITLELPPLRQRPPDVLPLAEHFLEQFCRDAGRHPLKLTAEARRRLEHHDWPGNVRELRNLMERVAFLCPADRVEAGDLTLLARPAAEPERFAGMSLAQATDAFQREHISRAIDRARNNMSEAAKLLGLHRPNLYRKMKMLGMEVS